MLDGDKSVIFRGEFMSQVDKFSYLRDFIVINGKMEVCVDLIGCHALGFGNINFQTDFGCIFS